MHKALFADFPFHKLRDPTLSAARGEVEGAKDEEILAVSEEDFVAYVAKKHCFEPIVLNEDAIYATEEYNAIPEGYVGSGRTHRVACLRFHIPFTGDEKLLRATPSQYSNRHMFGRIEGDEVCFDVDVENSSAEEIEKRREGGIALLNQHLGNLAEEVARLNSLVTQVAQTTFRARKEVLLKRAKKLSALSVPIKRKTDVPSTFAVPVARKKIVERPVASGHSSTPAWVIVPEVYNEILRVIFEFGKQMERSPSVYVGKGEETLRDHFLMLLAPHFDSTTGETFNREGKTDILIKHERTNVFVAECKFWGGKREFTKTIDQLLRNLTWRDSKAAVVLFVESQKLSPILEAIQVAVPEHPQFVKQLGCQHEGWYMYDFHLPGDEGLPVHLAVLAFHLPPVTSKRTLKSAGAVAP